MKILCLTDRYLDFLGDQILYGLRYHLGSDVVDFPKKEILYKSYKDKIDSSMLWAGGGYAFGMEESNIDREEIEQKIKNHYFDWIINLNCWRINSQNLPNLIAIDGEDHSLIHPKYYGRVIAYFKRELLANVRGILPIQFSLPDHLLDLSIQEKIKEIHASFSIYPGIREEISQFYPTAMFSQWHDYMNDVKKSWFGVSPKGAGYDCQRHYEILGNAILCIYIDHGAPRILKESFIDNVNCLIFQSVDELRGKIISCRNRESLIERGRNDLRKYHLSSVRALQILDKLENFKVHRKKYFFSHAIKYSYYPFYKRKFSNRYTAFLIGLIKKYFKSR